MWKKKYKNYKVNHKHENIWHAKSWWRGFREGWLHLDTIRDVRSKPKWRAVCLDSRNKTDEDKQKAWCEMFPYNFQTVIRDENDLYTLVPEGGKHNVRK